MTMIEPKPCPTIAIIAVQEVMARHKQELDAVIRLAADASGIPEGEPWHLNIQTSQWTKPERKTDALDAMPLAD